MRHALSQYGSDWNVAEQECEHLLVISKKRYELTPARKNSLSIEQTNDAWHGDLESHGVDRHGRIVGLEFRFELTRFLANLQSRSLPFRLTCGVVFNVNDFGKLASTKKRERAP